MTVSNEAVWLAGYMSGREDECKSQKLAAAGDFLRFDEVAPNPYEAKGMKRRDEFMMGVICGASGMGLLLVVLKASGGLA